MRPKSLVHPGPFEPYDERDTVFARTRLKPGTEQYEEYYARRPQWQERDDRTRALRNLASPGTRRYRPGAGALVDATFEGSDVVAAAIDAADKGPPFGRTPSTLGLAETGEFLGPRHPCEFSDVGIAPLDPEFVYTHRGRPESAFGEPITLKHTHAAVLAFPMRDDLVRSSPEMTATAETGRVYQVLSAACFMLADALKRMGIPARGHVDTSYLVIVPPLGVAAGLGELGRNGFLIHPTFGPGVRLGAVTFHADCAVDPEVCHGIADFCRVCGKCADNCPAKAIPEGEPEVLRGALKWPMRPARCYHYWRTQGTDCGLCIRTCPFAKPDTSLHKFVRWAIRGSTALNRFFLWCDDRIYGASPPSQPPPILTEGPTPAAGGEQ
jgi:ferredoxin